MVGLLWVVTHKNLFRSVFGAHSPSLSDSSFNSVRSTWRLYRIFSINIFSLGRFRCLCESEGVPIDWHLVIAKVSNGILQYYTTTANPNGWVGVTIMWPAQMNTCSPRSVSVRQHVILYDVSLSARPRYSLVKKPNKQTNKQKNMARVRKKNCLVHDLASSLNGRPLFFPMRHIEESWSTRQVRVHNTSASTAAAQATRPP